MFNRISKLIGFSLCLLFPHLATAQLSGKTSSSWENTLNSKKGIIVVYWNAVKPFVYKNSKNQMEGIEVDLIKGFQEYLSSQYDVSIEIFWKELSSFNQVYTTVQNTHGGGVFGISSFSILENRKQDLNFSSSYLKDISIIVSNNTIPSSNTKYEFLKSLNNLKALTLLNSTYEKSLLDLKHQYNLQFDIDYIKSADEIANRISSEKNSFGYLELPHYLSVLNEGLSVKRHKFAPVVREGYAITFPIQSDWKEPMESYFNRVSFQYKKDQIISKYLGVDVLKLINRIDSDSSIDTSNEIGLLNKEKEIQALELNKAALQQQKQSLLRNFLIIGLLFILIVATVLFYNNRQTAKINELLLQQQLQIQEQQKAIAQQNESLETNNKKLKKLNEQKNDLISVLSHDLRVPINQIKGFAEIYKTENKTLSMGQTDLINRIISTSNRLISMIRKIMDIEVVGANKMEINMERINLSQLLKEITASFEKSAKNKNISITAKIEEENLHVKADQTYLTQVFENLVSNAIKFSESNKAIEIKLHLSANTVMAMVKDQGPGLTKDDQKRLFKKYQQLSAKPTNGEQSIGLGLSIVKNYVEKMNGKVWAESTHGEGSTFIVEFEKVA